MQLTLDEDQLTAIIKEAFEHYKSKPFGFASFTEKPNGIEVQFHDASDEVRNDEPEKKAEDIDPLAAAKQMMTTWALMGLGSGDSGGGFGGGFGGGSSGGGGATGQW